MAFFLSSYAFNYFSLFCSAESYYLFTASFYSLPFLLSSFFN